LLTLIFSYYEFPDSLRKGKTLTEMARYVPLAGSPLDSIQDGRIGRINAGFRQP